jgi:hypothetical protein
MYGKGEVWSRELMSFVLPVPAGPHTIMPMIVSVASAQENKNHHELCLAHTRRAPHYHSHLIASFP